jgi:PAS domain S-box-containing protein
MSADSHSAKHPFPSGSLPAQPKRASARLDFITEAAGLVAWEWNPATDQLAQSANAPHMLGLPADAPLTTGREYLALVHPDDRPRVREALARTVERELPYRQEYRLARPDGTIMWVLDQARVIRGDEDRPRCVEGVLQDITDRRRAEAARDESERRFQKLADSIPQLVWMADASGRIFWCNQRWLDYTGMTPEQLRNGGREKLHHPDHIERVAEKFRRDFAAGKPWEDTFPLRGRDGGYRWFLSRAFPIRDESGRPTIWFGTNTDVTEQREAGRARALLAAIVESSQDAIISKTLEGIITSWNAGAERLFGYSADEVVGRSITILIPPERLEEEDHILSRLRRGQRIEHFDTVRVAKDGRRIDISLTISPVRDESGRIVGASKVARDITERVRNEAELIRLRQQLTADLDGMLRLHEISTQLVRQEDLPSLLKEIVGAAIAVTEAHMGNIQLLDSATGRLEVAAQLGFDPSFSRFIDCIEKGQAACGAAVERGERIVVEDVAGSPLFQDDALWEQMLTAGARAVQATPLVSHEGQLLGVLSTHYRRPHSPEQRELRLLDLLARQAADFIERMQADEALLEADRRKSEFLALLGHELRNPLAAVVNGIRVLNAGDVLDPQTRQVCELIERQARHMTRLLDDLLDVTRISRGKIVLRKQRLELVELIENTAADQRASVRQAGRALAVDLPSRPIWVEGDPTRLAQVLDNLLHNAIKFTDSGGRITVEAWSDPRHAHLVVRDNGIGIGRETLPKLFEPFSQEESSLGRNGGGLGLGLALVKGLVELHGGAISAHSDGPGRGSEFRVRLPLAVEQAPAPADEAEASRPSAHSAGYRVLVVEDSPPIAKIFAMLLRQMGHEARIADSGAAALEQIAAWRPEIVFSDISMPGMSGYELARQIRQHAGGGDILLVAMTGHGQAEDRQRALDAGFDEHLVKPAEMDRLEAIFQRAAQRRGG